jgi:hypothetical protein
MRFATSFQPQTETPTIHATASRAAPKNTNEWRLKASSRSQTEFLFQAVTAQSSSRCDAAGPSAAKATTPPAEARKVALLCRHHFDRVRVLVIASALRLNGEASRKMAKPFPNSEAAWGLRAYLILIGCAADRQRVTYDALARRIKRDGPNPLAKPLALITRWCQNHSLPALTSLVVEQATGLPASDFVAVSREEISREQGRVWAFDWFAIIPPAIEELVED